MAAEVEKEKLNKSKPPDQDSDSPKMTQIKLMGRNKNAVNKKTEPPRQKSPPK